MIRAVQRHVDQYVADLRCEFRACTISIGDAIVELLIVKSVKESREFLGASLPKLGALGQ